MLVWLLCWLILFILLIIAVMSRSPIFILVIVLMAVMMGIVQCIYCSEEEEESTGMLLAPSPFSEASFGAAKPANYEANQEPLYEMEQEYTPIPVYPPHTNIGAVECANRCSDPLWQAGYQLEPWCNEEQKLQEMALAATAVARAETLPEPLPKCSTEPPPCEMRTAWQTKFVGCPSVFIECPEGCKKDGQGRDMYKRDDQLWNRRLTDLIQERSVLSGEIWDPYKHFNARQKLTQILSEDMVHRKDKYMRPIENLEQAYCFGGK